MCAAEAQLHESFHNARTHLVEREERARKRRDDLIGASSQVREHLDTLADSRTRVLSAYEEAKALLADQERYAHTAERRLRQAHQLAAAANLQSRFEDARRIEIEIVEAERQIASNLVHDQAMAQLTEPEGARVWAEAKLEASAGRKRVRAERELTVRGDDDTALAPGEALERSVSDELDLEAVGVVRLTVEGGAGVLA